MAKAQKCSKCSIGRPVSSAGKFEGEKINEDIQKKLVAEVLQVDNFTVLDTEFSGNTTVDYERLYELVRESSYTKLEGELKEWSEL